MRTHYPALTRRLVRLVAALLVTLVAAMAALPALAAEAIDSFTSNVTLRVDGSVEVTEIIEVQAEGIRIRRGIFRDVPTFLVNADKSRLRADLDVIAVERDGQAEPYTLESLGGGFQRIRIGNPDVFLPSGPHRYTIRYTMTRMGRLFADHDELYWNATGNYWELPIRQSVTNVRLPEGAVISGLAGYTGRPGSTEQAVTITQTADNAATFRTTRVLAAGEGVTVAAMFQKGVLTEPTDLRRLTNWVSDHRDTLLPIGAVLIVLLSNLGVWFAVGRDPARGTIIPLFHPPKGFSPALVHYVARMGWRNTGWTAFTAALFDLGVKGLVTIDNTKKTLKVTVTGKAPDEPLKIGEQLLFDYLKSKGTLVVNTTNGPKIHETRLAFIRAIETENREVYFKNNYGYVLLLFLIAAVLLGLLVLFDVISVVTLILAVVVGVILGLFSGLLQRFWQGNLTGKFMLAIWAVLVVLNLGGSAADLLSSFRIDTGVIAVASIAAILIVFTILMRAPTVQGRKVMDQIEGLKMYLETAEEKRLNFTAAPPMTVERFERLLPYAIALGVEKPWSEHFDAELKRHAVAGMEDTSTYRPAWYHGSDWSSSKGGFSNTVAAATSGMAAAMIAAQPAASSSSGFSGGGGGGGFSGGGGGGGGGGGW